MSLFSLMRMFTIRFRMLGAIAVVLCLLGLLGSAEDSGKLLGLDRDWAARAIKAAGNYGEMFQRNVGNASPLKLPRGLNALWSKGGLMYAPPVR